VRLTAEARFQSGANICKTFRAERDILTGFSLSATIYATCIIPANVLHSLTCHRRSATESVINTIIRETLTCTTVKWDFETRWLQDLTYNVSKFATDLNVWLINNNNNQHHHLQEGLGLIPVPCILKMKLVRPSLPRSSYVSSSFWFIL